MENNKREDKYYKVYLNGPKEMFYEGYNCRDSSRIKLTVQEQKFKKEKREEWGFWRSKEYEVDVPYMQVVEKYVTIFCKSVNGNLFDVITNDEYVYAEYDKNDQYDSITYRHKEPVSIEEVYNELRKMNSALIRSYTNKMDELFYIAHAKYMSYMDKQRKQQIWEETREERETKYEDFIDNFHNNYGSSNTKNRKK